MSDMLKANTTLTSLILCCITEDNRNREYRINDRMTGNDIGDEGEKMVKMSWGSRGGNLQL